MVLFIKPQDLELRCTKVILDCFGEASGLVANMQKSCFIPIACNDQAVQESGSLLQCPSTTFPCTYLGLPISNKKLSKGTLMVWVEKIADRLPSWKASLLNLAGRTALVHFCSPLFLFTSLSP